jgi:hypothetical protein
MEEAEKDSHTIRRINPSDLQTIGHILTIYAQGMRSVPIISSRRDAYLESVEKLCERITAMVTDAEQDFPLTPAELDLIDCAFTTFLDAIDACVPPSAERDEVIRGCKAFQAYVLSGALP